MQHSYNKYGESCFIFDVIERIEDTDILIEREGYWINFYHSNERDFGFNARINTTNNFGTKRSDESRLNMSNAQKGRKKSEEHKKKLSEANKGKILSEETRAKISMIWRGRKHTEETKAKMSASSKGKPKSIEARKNMSIAKSGKPRKPMSEETKKKLSESRMGEKNPMYGVTSPFKGKHHSNEAKEHRRKKMREWGILHPDANRGENNAFYGHHHTEASKSRMSEVRKEYYKTHESYRLRPVVCLNDDATILSRYDSVGSAALAVNRSNATISGACSGRQHTCIGYKWMYESDYLETIGGNASNAS